MSEPHLEKALEVSAADLITLCRDKEFRHALNGELIVFNLRQQIKRLRLHRGWTQKELAVKAGLNVSTIIRLERLRIDGWLPSIKTLQVIAVAFDVALVVRFQEWSVMLDQIAAIKKRGVDIPRSWDRWLTEVVRPQFV